MRQEGADSHDNRYRYRKTNTDKEGKVTTDKLEGQRGTSREVNHKDKQVGGSKS